MTTNITPRKFSQDFTITAAKSAIRKACGAISGRQPNGGTVTQMVQATGAKATVEVQADYNTGCWQFDAAKQQHVIKLGDRFTDSMRTNACNAYSLSGQAKAAAKYGEQILRHEAWHGRVSERDLTSVAEQCRVRAVPFVLVNLMEDMRLEHIARRQEGVSFDWWKYTTMPEAKCPLSAFVRMIQAEQAFSVNFAVKHPKAKEWKDMVESFARRVRDAADTMAIVKIAQEWVRYWTAEWPQDMTINGGQYPTGLSDTLGGETDGSLKTIDTSNIDFTGKAGTSTTQTNTLGSATVKRSAAQGRQWTHYQSPSGGFPLNPREADAIANEMRQIIARSASANTARATTSGSRLHLAGIASRSEQCFRSAGTKGGKPHLLTIVDFSGSMASDWLDHGRYFVAAVLRLLRRGDITGKIYLTGGGGYAELPVTTTDAQLNTISPWTQGEAIRQTLTKLDREVVAAHATVIYTDGELMDGFVQASDWRSKGAELVGSIVIPTHRTEKWRDNKTAIMTKHFGAPVIGQNGKELARKLAQHLGSRFR